MIPAGDLCWPSLCIRAGCPHTHEALLSLPALYTTTTTTTTMTATTCHLPTSTTTTLSTSIVSNQTLDESNQTLDVCCLVRACNFQCDVTQSFEPKWHQSSTCLAPLSSWLRDLTSAIYVFNFVARSRVRDPFSLGLTVTLKERSTLRERLFSLQV